MTLKDLVYKILLENSETRDSDKKLIWEVWTQSNLIENINFFYDSITYENFMKAPSPESCRRCRQALQRSDLLTGAKLIQPTKETKQKRVKLAKEKGFSYMEGKQPVYNPEKGVYEI
jgi:hypothetical protein